MTLSELNNVLESTRLPVAYGYFNADDPNLPDLPCITYEVAYSDHFAADNKVYKKIQHADIFLWTRKKDLVTEEALENALDGASLVYRSTETYLTAEKAYQIIYEVEI